MSYVGFSKLKEMISKNKNVFNPGAVAAAVGMRKYGKKNFEKHAHEGKKMEHAKKGK